MLPTADGSFHLFRAFGINVYLHWTWFVVAWLFYSRQSVFGSGGYFVLTYGSLFAIVLMHEFGHALACRSVGGRASRIVLWPLGGVAYVEPPERPLAVLWSIAAGPLVNVLLAPITILAWLWASANPGYLSPEVLHYLTLIMKINLTLLIFNLLPIYPLDGGQMLMAVLWLLVGRAKGLRISATIGLTAAVVLAMLALVAISMGHGMGTWWFILAVFVGWQAFTGFRIARYLAQEERVEREEERRLAEQYGQWGAPAQRRGL